MYTGTASCVDTTNSTTSRTVSGTVRVGSGKTIEGKCPPLSSRAIVFDWHMANVPLMRQGVESVMQVRRYGQLIDRDIAKWLLGR